MTIDINWIAILGGTAVSMVLGMVWYHEKVMGKKWIDAIGMSKDQMQEGQIAGMVSAVPRAFLLAFSMYHIIYVTADFFSDNSWLVNSSQVAFWVGVGFVWTTLLMHDKFEMAPKNKTIANVGFEIACVMAVGLAIGLIGI